MVTMDSGSLRQEGGETLAGMAAGIVSAYVANNALPPAQVPELIQSVVRSLSEAESAPAPAVVAEAPVVAPAPAPVAKAPPPAPVAATEPPAAPPPAPEAAAPAPPAEAATPAVSVDQSIIGDFLICLECGLQFKTLKRHLRTAHGLSPDEYRAKYNLPDDYPMVAPNYAQRRSDFAKKIGLGRKREAA